MRTIPENCKHYLQLNSMRYLYQPKTFPGYRRANRHTKLREATLRVTSHASFVPPSWSLTAVFALRTVGLWRFPWRQACGALFPRGDRRGVKQHDDAMSTDFEKVPVNAVRWIRC